MKKRQRKDIVLSAEEMERLATYNAERRRGLLHNDIYNRDMALLQARYDQYIVDLARLAGR